MIYLSIYLSYLCNDCRTCGYYQIYKIFCVSVRASDKRIACDEEFSDSEDEGEGGRRNVADHKKGAKKARIEEDKKETEDKKTGRFMFW